MNKIQQFIREVLSTPPSEDKCNCGCHSCENVGNPGPVINESLNAKIVMSENMKYHVENKLPISENVFRYGSEVFLDIWAEARYLYSRNAIHLNEEDKKTILETNLGEYGIYKGQKVPLDISISENELGTKHDISPTSKNSVIPFHDLLLAIKKDHSDKSKIFKDAALAVIDKDAEELKKVLRDYGVYYEYEHLLGLNESKDKKTYVYVRNPKTKKIKKTPFGMVVKKETLHEDSASKLYKIEGLLVTNNDIKWQKELLSDIRSITGVTTIDAREYIPRISKENYSYERVTVKIDPYPYLKFGKFDLDTIKQVIQNINNIKGVVKFKVNDPQMINIGV